MAFREGQCNGAAQGSVIFQMTQTYLRSGHELETIFHHLTGEADEIFSAAQRHASADANEVRGVECSHVAQSLPQVIGDLFPFLRAQRLGGLAIDAADPVA